MLAPSAARARVEAFLRRSFARSDDILGAIAWLDCDRTLARMIKVAGVLTMLLSRAWAAALLHLQYHNLDGDVLSER